VTKCSKVVLATSVVASALRESRAAAWRSAVPLSRQAAATSKAATAVPRNAGISRFGLFPSAAPKKRDGERAVIDGRRPLPSDGVTTKTRVPA
jgi:hypothetical protein